MAKDAIVSQELADKFKTEKDSPYLRFVRGEGLDIISAQYVPNLRTAELKPWARKSGKGVFINHEASRTSNDCYVCEIAPGRKLEPQHHLFEEMILVLSGRGSTTVWNNAGARVTFEWKAGAIFAIPLNCWYQHFNGSGQEPVRYVAVTNAPSVINLYDDIDFVFNHRHDFVNRFSGEADYYSAKGEQIGFLLQTNFVSDAVNLPLIAAKERGAGGGHIRFNMARGSIASHISQFPVGTYKKAHAHGPGAHVIVLSGEGYSLMWPEGEEPRRYDWQVGTLIVPPNAWFHQHFNSGPTPARYLAFKHWSPRNAQGVPISWISRRLGGTQVDYADEHPLVRRLFAEALARHGLEPRMDAVYAAELPESAAQGGVGMARQRKRPARRLPFILRLMHARPRLLLSVAIGIAVTLALSLSELRTTTRIVLGWDAGVALYLVLTYVLMARSTIAGIREHAAQDDEGRVALLVLTVLAALASLGVIIAELGIGDGDKRTGTQLALATLTIFLSWTFIHTIFALNYAHDYYGEHGAKRSGLKFPDDADPDYWDFVYFSFVVGMTCQVSDVAVASQPIRRTVIAHGVVSFFFNTALLALTVNIAASAI